MSTDTLQASARTALACLDLTSLNDADTPADIEALCARAQGRFGPTAAVCVWPRFAAQARALLPAGIAVAAVANFPAGGTDTERAVRETGSIVQAGAQEVDVVLPYRDLAAAPALLAAVRRACAGLRLKVILETGELHDAAAVARASRIALDAGADFLKTSTGKTARSASPEAARVMLAAIAADAGARGRVGFKPAGGIRTVADAAVYIALVAEHLGAAALVPARFRIGASGLLNDIEAVLGDAARPLAGSTY
ncbi:MAG: deoxyribose-phosphate aldolase [Burkholderiales bacterium]|nr:deoxyribose-phosphate aldolase [Burkholderiales bacterium]